MSKSSKQKLNTKSSTEAELVGASDYLPYSIWAKKFMERQGHVLKENRFYQDNLSTIRFEKNGRKSCGPNSRHIDIRYFWIKDRLDLDSFDITYCPTLQMLADFFTKPLQGSLFRKLRDVVMGHKHVSTLKEELTLAPSQERVAGGILLGKSGNGPNGRTTDEINQQPSVRVRKTVTYADAVRRRPQGQMRGPRRQ